ncbi:hypothetical protein M5C72_01945 [Companilactobacillus allii]|uniref:Uncharacterized protein n=1 Tax=Companilactobacillus allii TaxID=1847728 RepID=A0A1P8Q266_9LACO|nr:hypothetical protein [Companilactobacillus allii]APX71926.1 hypothetical protein BTM29_04865 [Companilactobacillus allii]USQ69020.1 hypothetical protein M5C72_01945 [Companilactobacillus allii]
MSYKFDDIVLSTNFLLNDGINLMYKKEDFTVDNDIIALINIKDTNEVDGQTIVIHNEYGIFFVDKTTKQLMNEFHKYNRVGFLVSKFLAGFFHLKYNIPMVMGYSAYMPMIGGSRSCADWIGVHWVKSCRQEDKVAIFKLEVGGVISLAFPIGDLSDRVHNVCFLTENHIVALEEFSKLANGRYVPSGHVGLLRPYRKCKCKVHGSVPSKWKDVNYKIDMLVQYLLDIITHGELGSEESITVFKQKISREKRLY